MQGPILLILLLAQWGTHIGRAQFDIRLGFATPELAGAPSEDEFLGQLVGNELDSLDQELGCSSAPDGIARRMDRLAERLSMAVDGAKLARDELADAVGLRELVEVLQPEQHRQRPAQMLGQPQRFRSDLGSRDLDQLLEPENRFIYRGPRLADQAIMQLAREATNRALLSEQEQLFSDKMFDYAAKRTKEEPSKRLEQVRASLQGAASMGAKAVQFVYHWADQLYFESEFLEVIPVLGEGVKKLKELGQRPFEIMDTVRYMHRMWSKLRRELPEPDSQTRRLLASEPTKKMLTDSGLATLKRLAAKLLAMGTGTREATIGGSASQDAAIKEIVSRCAYYLFSQLVPRSAYCLIGRNYRRTAAEQRKSDQERVSKATASAANNIAD